MLYLTSRPILLATKTRSFLVCLKQGDVRLPLGPLQCSREKVERVIWREVRHGGQGQLPGVRKGQVALTGGERVCLPALVVCLDR